jgi:hypothetical protein
MKTKVTAIIERNHEGYYSIYTLESFEKFGIFGYGNTKEEAIENFWQVYREYREQFSPEDVPDLDVSFRYDAVSFLQEWYQLLGLTELREMTGLTANKLLEYIYEVSVLRPAAVNKIEGRVQQYADALRQVSLMTPKTYLDNLDIQHDSIPEGAQEEVAIVEQANDGHFEIVPLRTYPMFYFGEGETLKEAKENLTAVYEALRNDPKGEFYGKLPEVHYIYKYSAPDYLRYLSFRLGSERAQIFTGLTRKSLMRYATESTRVSESVCRRVEQALRALADSLTRYPLYVE